MGHIDIFRSLILLRPIRPDLSPQAVRFMLLDPGTLGSTTVDEPPMVGGFVHVYSAKEISF